jgi:hypothetical protein
MTSRVFRKVALDRLSSPEQLDQLVQVTPPQGWVALGILAGLLLAVVLWGWFGSISVEITAAGILQLRESRVAFPLAKQELEAILLLPVEEGRKVAPGMEAHLFLGTRNDDEQRFISGDVRGVEVVTGDGGQFARVEVSVRQGGNASASSLIQSSSLNSTSSAKVTGRIVVQHTRPLQLLIPALRGLGGM